MIQDLLHLITLFAQTLPSRPGGDFSFADVPYLILGILICAVVVGVSTNIWDQQERDRKRQRDGGQRTMPRPTPLPAVSGQDPVMSQNSIPEPPPHPQRITAAERRHTLVVGSEGDGKTQTQIAFLVGDIRRGEQVVWASTNLALFHSRDQQTDLRPLAHLFEYTSERREIMAVLLWAAAEVDRRMLSYRADTPHGDPVIIYVDELGGLYRDFGETLVRAMRMIAEQGRKVDVFLFLVAHNTLKESTGLDLALKALFKTRLLGNVDQATWTAMVGPGIKLRGVPDGQGLWHQPDKRGTVFPVTVHRPSAQDITRIAAMRPRNRPSILDAAQSYREELAAEKPVAAKPGLPVPPVWEPSELHLQVQELVQAALPEIIRIMTVEGLSLAKAQELTQTSNRALARRLGLGSNGGVAAVRIGDAIKEWEREGGVRLFDVPDLSVDSRIERAEQGVRVERAERAERVEHLTPAA